MEYSRWWWKDYIRAWTGQKYHPFKEASHDREGYHLMTSILHFEDGTSDDDDGVQSKNSALELYRFFSFLTRTPTNSFQFLSLKRCNTMTKNAISLEHHTIAVQKYCGGDTHPRPSVMTIYGPICVWLNISYRKKLVTHSY